MNLSWQTNLDRAIDGRAKQVVAVRRHIHAHPEASGEEYRTSRYLCQLLGEHGLNPQLGPDGRGLIVDSCETDCGRIALRADIDALSINDAKDVVYRSRHDGLMHACGHDVHAAILFGAILALVDLKNAEQLPWPTHVRGLFQPAEETATGAAEMVAAGALKEVQAIIALHVDPTMAVGTVGLRSGVATAHCDELDIVLTGRGGHAARPHDTADPIVAASQLINSMYLTIPRVTDSRDAVVVSFGRIEGGRNSNVIPEQVHLQGTLRTLDTEVRKCSKNKIYQICEGIAASSGVSIDAKLVHEIDSICNDAATVELLRRVSGELLGSGQVAQIPRPSMGSEDFSVYLKHVPGAMLRLGTRSPGKEQTPLHTVCFDVDEEAIAVGTKILARSVVEWSKPRIVRGQSPKIAGLAK